MPGRNTIWELHPILSPSPPMFQTYSLRRRVNKKQLFVEIKSAMNSLQIDKLSNPAGS
jgi:hypothetical protein